jgi:hypothetical protein
LQAFVPGGLPVVVGVDVDETGRNHGSVRLDLASARRTDEAHLDDAIPVDGDIGRTGRGTRPVDHGAGSDHEVKWHEVPPLI